MAGLLAILGSSVDGLVMSPGRVLSTAQASGAQPRVDAPFNPPPPTPPTPPMPLAPPYATHRPTVFVADRALCFVRAQPTLSLSMAAPKGPWGGSTDSNEGWFMDRGRSAQVKKFEGGSDYLFFQGPSPLYAVQPDLPGVLTGVRTGHGLQGSGAQLHALIVSRRRTPTLTLTHAQASGANGGDRV